MNNYQAVFRRKEIKYLLSQRQLDALLPVLEQHMVPDDFAHSSISNLYYDTPDFRMIRRSLEKPKYKEKLRLRCYQTPRSDTPAFLEIKKKVSGFFSDRMHLTDSGLSDFPCPSQGNRQRIHGHGFDLPSLFDPTGHSPGQRKSGNFLCVGLLRQRGARTSLSRSSASILQKGA